jgi:polysaccharide deacetylase family protein (PEP-CTERM system associated)
MSWIQSPHVPDDENLAETSWNPTFLLSVDLEDPRSLIPDGDVHEDRVQHNVSRILEFLSERDIHCTFFAVGATARQHPSLIRDIVNQGHEVACHGSDHQHLDCHDPESLRADICRNIEDLLAAGADRVTGFRAPTFSLTLQTTWAYDVLAEIGLSYSSSVLPAWNPLYGWPGFNSTCERTDTGIWELPVTVTSGTLLNVPIVGGTYLRTLPYSLIVKQFVRQVKKGRPVIGYFHPYDIDVEQERYRHPLVGSKLNWLMYVGRDRVFDRLHRLLATGAAVTPYIVHVRNHLEPLDQRT